MSEARLIAIVDDDASARQALSALLRAMGFRVAEFGSGPEILETMPMIEPDCLIADNRMPAMTGLELHRRLHETGRRLPTILITAFPTAPVTERARAEGILAVLTKPLEPGPLAAAIAAALGDEDGEPGLPVDPSTT